MVRHHSKHLHLQAVGVLLDIQIRRPTEAELVISGAGSNGYRLHHHLWTCKPQCKALIMVKLPAHVKYTWYRAVGNLKDLVRS